MMLVACTLRDDGSVSSDGGEQKRWMHREANVEKTREAERRRFLHTAQPISIHIRGHVIHSTAERERERDACSQTSVLLSLLLRAGGYTFKASHSRYI